MLGSKTKPHNAGSARSGLSIIGQDVTITGNLTATGDVHLDGTVEGDTHCAGLTIGATGRARGNIMADKAQIAGQVEGTISVRELVVEATARIVGEFSYESVNIATGAHVEGRVAHRAPEDQTQALKLVAHSAE